MDTNRSEPKAILIEIDLLVHSLYRGTTLPTPSPAAVLAIENGGALDAVICRQSKAPKGHYEILRHLLSWRLAQAARHPTVPALVYELSDKEAADLVRTDIESWETGFLKHKNDPVTAAEKIRQSFKSMDGDIRGRLTRLATMYGVTRAAIWQRLAILHLDKEILELGRKNRLSFSHLRVLSGVEPVNQVSLARDAFKHKLTVKALVERAAAKRKQDSNKRSDAPESEPETETAPTIKETASLVNSAPNPDTRRLERSLQDRLGCNVSLTDETLTMNLAGNILVLSGVLDQISDALPKTGSKTIFDGHNLVIHFNQDEALESFLRAMRVELD